MSDQDFPRPFPALTPAQRYHLDVFGYVIIPDLLSADEIARMKDALYALRDELKAAPPPPDDVVRGAFLMIDQPHHTYMGSIAQSYPALAEYTSHPRVVGISEELIGGDAHILEVNAHINTKAPDWPMGEDGQPVFGFHRGLPAGEWQQIKNGLYHSSFVKVLTNLTDIGPDDGGTVVIAGSHKIDAEHEGIIKAAYEDRSLIHKVVAPAGSGLLFTEALMHATGQITSDNERVIIICGYGVNYFPWLFMDSHRPGFALDPAFMERIPEPLRHLYISKGYIQRKHRYRELSDAVDETPAEKIPWPSW